MACYGDAMMEGAMSEVASPTAIDTLQEDLLRGDRVIDSAGPVLRHLLTNEDHSLFSDEIVARVRGMVGDIARQLLFAQADVAEVEDSQAFVEERQEELVAALLANPLFPSHAHALALEWQLTGRLEACNAIDPVLSPLLQALLASSDPETAAMAMNLLASQARFAQQQRRMELPIGELPGDLFHSAMLTFRAYAGRDFEEAAEVAEAELRMAFDESRSRIGLLSRVTAAMGGGAIAALSLSHAGVAIFLTALARASAQDRNLAILSTNETQLARFALLLRAAGLKLADVEAQFALVHPQAMPPEGIGQLGADRAAALLSDAAVRGID